MSDYSLLPASVSHIPAIVGLMMVQQSRQLERDGRLKGVDSRDQIEMALAESINNHAQTGVVLDREGNVCGYAHPSLWTLQEGSRLLSFLTARNGIVQRFTFPDPADEQGGPLINTLLDFLDVCWQNAGTSGDLIRWPSTDRWIEPFILNHGFQLDSVCALRSLQPFFTTLPIASPHLRFRSARPEDEEALLHLLEQELLFHERYTPFVRSSLQVLEAFRRDLQPLWQGRSLEEGAPLVLVVEQGNEIVAMAENSLLEVGPNDEPGFTPPGHYWCIDNVSVREDLQGQGIGRLLVRGIEALSSLQLDLNGYVLWFNPDNPKAASFWTRLGFQPLWTTYQRLRTS